MTRKVLIIFTAVMLITSTLLGVLFYRVVTHYIVENTFKQLEADAQRAVADVRDETRNVLSLDNLTARERIGAVFLRLVRRINLSESILLLVDQDGTILFTQNDEFEKATNLEFGGFRQITGTKSGTVRYKQKDYLYYRLPLSGQIRNNQRITLVILSSLEDIQIISRRLLRNFLLALIICSGITFIAGVFLSRKITEPVKQLKKQAAKLAQRDFDCVGELKTGDELEDLANTMKNMAAELKKHDLLQKRFLQNASHELKTPLMSIQGYAEGIKDGVLSGEQAEKGLDVIISESIRLKGIVEDIILLSRLETAENVYHFQKADLAGVIEDSIEKVRSLAQKSNKQINIEKLDSAFASIDIDRITQALINVIGNCIRYAVSVVQVSASACGGSYHIMVTDDGPGFNENEEDKVFERFYKGDKGGSGLGLAITKTIIEGHGGKISAKNAPGGGASFTIALGLNPGTDFKPN